MSLRDDCASGYRAEAAWMSSGGNRSWNRARAPGSPATCTLPSAIAADLAPQADLNTGSARTALRKAVLAARNGDPR